MRHITEQYGIQVNFLEMRTEDFCQLRDFLRVVGADIRIMTECAGICTVQIRNDGDSWDFWDMDKMGARE